MTRPSSFLHFALALCAPLAAAAAVSVTDFGAKGDGVADDTRAIQSALDSGKNVVIPAGTFRVSNALSPKAHQVIELIGTVRVADSHIQPLTADAAAVIKDVRLIENRIQTKREPFDIAAECTEQVTLERNETSVEPAKENKAK